MWFLDSPNFKRRKQTNIEQKQTHIHILFFFFASRRLQQHCKDFAILYPKLISCHFAQVLIYVCLLSMYVCVPYMHMCIDASVCECSHEGQRSASRIIFQNLSCLQGPNITLSWTLPCSLAKELQRSISSSLAIKWQGHSTMPNFVLLV